MTMQLYIVYGNDTLDFQSDGCKLVDGFYPETPDEGAESITDQFNIVIRGSDNGDLRSKITEIRLTLEYARRHKDDAQAAWIYYEVDNSGDAWMSKLLGGTILYDDRLGRNWRQNLVTATIIIERMPYWDAKEELQVPLTNGNGDDDLNGLIVYNHDDSGTNDSHDNWMDIAAEDIDGDLPGPTRLEITNTFASHLLYTVWIGQNWTDPDNFTHILEGESSSTGTDRSDQGCSNAGYKEFALSPSAETDMFTWALNDGLMDACQGRYYKIMARFLAEAPTNVKLRLQLQYAVTHIWQSGQITVDSSRALQIRDLFTLRLPPWLLGQTNLEGLTMILTGQQNTGSPINVNLDFLQITPLDGWRMLECAGYGIAQNERIIDDGINGSFYIDNGSGDNKAGILVGYGNPITLYPGKKQRLYFLLHSNIANTAEILRTVTVKLYYKPRRRTL
jgi:hypothetical protein